MGREAVADFPKPKLPDSPEKKRAKKVTTEEEDEDEDRDRYWDDSTAEQAFNVAHDKVFGSNAKTGLRLVILVGLEAGESEFEEMYVIEHKPSRLHKESIRSGGACIVSLANLVAPPAQVTSDIKKFLKDGFEIDLESEPGWLAIATCSYYE
jgi:hypothetical protein